MVQDAGEPSDSNIGRRRAAAAGGGRENYQDRRSEIVEAAVTLFREREEPTWLTAAHPDVARVTAQFAAAGVPPYHVLSVRQACDVLRT